MALEYFTRQAIKIFEFPGYKPIVYEDFAGREIRGVDDGKQAADVGLCFCPGHQHAGYSAADALAPVFRQEHIAQLGGFPVFSGHRQFCEADEMRSLSLQNPKLAHIRMDVIVCQQVGVVSSRFISGNVLTQ